MAKAKSKPIPQPTDETAEDAGARLLADMGFPDDPDTPQPSHYRAEPAEPVPAPTPKAHPAWLTRKGAQVGLDADEMAAMSADELKEAIAITGERTELNRAATRFNSAGMPINDAGQFVAANGQPKPAEPAQPDKPFDLRDHGIDPSKWNENTPVGDIIRDAVQPLIKRMTELEGALSQANQREQLRDANQHYDRLDKLFAKDPATFGHGTRDELDQSSSELAKRKSVIDRMAALYRQNPQQSLNQLFTKATKDLGYTAKPAAPAPEPVHDPKGFANGQVLKPGGIVSPKRAKGVNAATAAVDEILQKRAENVATTEEEDLPG